MGQIPSNLEKDFHEVPSYTNNQQYQPISNVNSSTLKIGIYIIQ